jgi:hypothetical protein
MQEGFVAMFITSCTDLEAKMDTRDKPGTPTYVEWDFRKAKASNLFNIRVHVASLVRNCKSRRKY